MRCTDNLNLVKVLIIFSFALIFSGVIFDLKNDKKLINPVKETYVLNDDNSLSDDVISITTIDGVEITPIDNNSESSNSSANVTSDGVGTDKSNGISDNNLDISNNAIDTPIVQDSNNILRNTIQDRYGITVKYGEETNGYTVGGIGTMTLTDSNSISVALNNLNNSLSVYPNSFFQEIKNGGLPLTLYLIKRYSTNNVTGVTDSTSNNIVISIATDYSFGESFHHEIYHYIERYIYASGGKYTTWSNLNPTDFYYGNQNSSLSYNVTNSVDVYFVNNYAQTSEEEDRASTFEYMTASYKSNCFVKDKPIWLKAKYMCEQIDAVFQSVNSQTIEYWERYVY